MQRSARSLRYNGLELVERFLTRYGTKADPDRPAFHRLLEEFS